MNIIFSINNYLTALLATATICTYNSFMPPMKTNLLEKIFKKSCIL